jgi:ribosomal protein S6
LIAANNFIYINYFRKYPAADGTRYFWEARYITTTFDASPKTLIDIDRLLKADDVVLRHFTTKPKSAIDKARGSSYRNPYLSTTKLPTTQ